MKIINKILWAISAVLAFLLALTVTKYALANPTCGVPPIPDPGCQYVCICDDNGCYYVQACGRASL